MKKLFSTSFVSLFFLFLFIPQIAFAAWWNPFTWDFSSWFRKTPVQEQSIASSTSATSTATLSEVDKLQLELNQEKAARLKLQGEISSINKNQPPVGASTKNITTPSGAVVDENGNVVSLPPISSQATQTAGQTTLTPKQIVAMVSPSVALISTPQGSGSGIVINGGKYILTNAHVVGSNSSVQVSLPSGSFTAPVLGKDDFDLALIYSSGHGLSSATLGSSDQSSLVSGDEVYALGYPENLSNLTITNGIFSGHQVIPWLTPGVKQDLLQTNAAINHGNSGGPLVDDKGEVVGINSYAPPSVLQTQGIYFAIPVDTVKAEIPALSQYGQSRFELYPIGSILTIKKSLYIKIYINEKMSCSQLLSAAADLTLCDLYRNYYSDYHWNMVDDLGSN